MTICVKKWRNAIIYYYYLCVQIEFFGFLWIPINIDKKGLHNTCFPRKKNSDNISTKFITYYQ